MGAKAVAAKALRVGDRAARATKAVAISSGLAMGTGADLIKALSLTNTRIFITSNRALAVGGAIAGGRAATFALDGTSVLGISKADSVSVLNGLAPDSTGSALIISRNDLVCGPGSSFAKHVRLTGDTDLGISVTGAATVATISNSKAIRIIGASYGMGLAICISTSSAFAKAFGFAASPSVILTKAKI